jgi:hypothetical protein
MAAPQHRTLFALTERLSSVHARRKKQTPRRKGLKMNNVIDMLRTAAKKHALYRQTRDEIARMPLDVALDLDIYPGDAERIAREAVYGHAA